MSSVWVCHTWHQHLVLCADMGCIQAQHLFLSSVTVRLLLQVAMAHAPVDEAPIPDGYSVSDEFFIYKFSKEQAGLSGLAFDEGIFGVFGYVTEVRFALYSRPAACHGGGPSKCATLSPECGVQCSEL